LRHVSAQFLGPSSGSLLDRWNVQLIKLSRKLKALPIVHSTCYYIILYSFISIQP